MGAMVTTGGVVRGVDVYTSGGGPAFVVASLGLLAVLVLGVSSGKNIHIYNYTQILKLCKNLCEEDSKSYNCVHGI